MDAWQIIAQTIGIVAMAMNILSFQCKQQKNIIFMQLFGALLFTVNFLILDAITGACLNFIAILRALVYANKERFHGEKSFWAWLFSALFISTYFLTFTVFGKEPTAFHLIIEVLPVIAMVVTTISFQAKKAATVRKLALIGSPLWLVYNCFCFSLGGILCEAISIVSVIIGMLRYDRKQD